MAGSLPRRRTLRLKTIDPGPPGWGLGVGLTPLPWKTKTVTETRNRGLRIRTLDVTEADTQDSGSPVHQIQNGLATQRCVHMKGVGQSREETNNRTTSSLLHPKHNILIGTWNVRTLYQTGRLAQTVKEMDRYGLDILGVCEARWSDRGRKDFDSGHTILYSGRDDDLHLNGVALLLSKTAKTSLLEWEPLGERLLRARFNSHYTKLTIVVCYAPQEDKSDEEKDNFYEKLAVIIDKTPRHDLLLVIGDMNAKLGTDNRGREQTMGREGLIGEMSDNGGRLAELCDENRLSIGGTIFKHKEIHKYTWTSPDNRTRNQIDHIIINNKWKSSLLDVRTRRGADVASDHELLVAKIRIKLRKTKLGDSRMGKFNVQRLRNEDISQQFKIELTNKFQALQEEEEISLSEFNKEILEVSQQVLGPCKRTKEAWISEDSWKLIEERKRIKHKMLNSKSPRIKENTRKEYSNMDKQVKKSTRNDKKVYYEALAEKAETASQKQDMRTLYQTAKQLGNTYTNNDVPVKDINGNLITSETEKLKRWEKHFETVLNKEPPKLRATIKPAETDLDISIEPPTINEIKKAIGNLNRGKAPGDDQVTAEMIQVEKELTPKLLHRIFQQIWMKEELPGEWSSGLIIKLPKKGDLSQCSNWRGIMLLSVTSKVFSRILLDRINPNLQTNLRKQQAGFRKGRSCTDHIFTLRQIFEQCQEWNASLYANFIDFEKAFDSVHRPALWNILRHYGVPAKIVNIIKLLYTDFHARVICGNKLTDNLKIETGVKQGCILSPFLFCLAIDWIMKESLSNRKTGLQWTFTETLDDLDYADDIVLLSQKLPDIQIKTHHVHSNAQKLGLHINAAKTKVMRINTAVTTPVKLGTNEIEDVTTFTYLGSKISLSGNSEEEIKERLVKARRAFGSLRNIWNSRKISTRTKLKFYKSNILSVLLYGAETWKTTAGISKRLDTFQNKCLRRILKIYWPNTISNKELLERTGMEPVSCTVTRRRWRWTGHVLRMEVGAIPRTALRWTPQGKRKQGRPLETWRRSLEREMRREGWTWGQISKMASDRDGWRSSISALCADQAPRG